MCNDTLKKKIDVDNLVCEYACSVTAVKSDMELYKLAEKQKEPLDCFHIAIPLLITYENRKE